MKAPADFPRLLAMFFSSHLMQQREASPHTIASYRDTFRLLVHYAQRELKKPPSELALEDFDSAFIGEFLSHLETERGNSARSRNARLAAIRSFFRQVALHEPQHAALAQRVLAMPSKRYLRSPVAWLDGDEVKALLSAPDPRTRFGRRDRTLLTVAVQTGLRASELIRLRCRDVHLGAGAHVRCHGKGRKERHTPLRRDAAAILKAWLKERGGEPDDTVFPNQHGRVLSHDSLSYLLAKHVATAR
ncbi:MAG: tyrosine-type recombinase/integrase, partial [Rhodospirillales bacterium]|nr:tyrosine-type recombinase/integrase [Rhodospirillales bacterium]